MEVLWFKIAAISVIFATGLGGGLVPIRLGVSPRTEYLLPLGNAFAAGIFLGAGLIHMLSDAQENFSSLNSGFDFPIALFLCGCGFLLVFFLEKLLLGSEDVSTMSEGRSVYPFVLTLVLSVHSVIAGASLGLEQVFASSMIILVAIIAHKGSAAFALSASLKNAQVPFRRLMAIIIFFSCMTPLGVVAGTAFTAVLTTNMATLTEAIFDALAAGTFLYVGILDIIEEVFARQEHLWLKFLLLAGGFGLMSLLAFWT